MASGVPGAEQVFPARAVLWRTVGPSPLRCRIVPGLRR